MSVAKQSIRDILTVLDGFRQEPKSTSRDDRFISMCLANWSTRRTDCECARISVVKKTTENMLSVLDYFRQAPKSSSTLISMGLAGWSTKCTYCDHQFCVDSIETKHPGFREWYSEYGLCEKCLDGRVL